MPISTDINGKISGYFCIISICFLSFFDFSPANAAKTSVHFNGYINEDLYNGFFSPPISANGYILFDTEAPAEFEDSTVKVVNGVLVSSNFGLGPYTTGLVSLTKSGGFYFTQEYRHYVYDNPYLPYDFRDVYSLGFCCYFNFFTDDLSKPPGYTLRGSLYEAFYRYYLITSDFLDYDYNKEFGVAEFGISASPAPEPGTWVALLTGFSLIGLRLRVRRGIRA